MSNPVFALGAKISYQEWDTTAATPTLKGAATEFARLRGLGSSTKTRTIADVTTISDLEIRRRPARKDPGTLQITLGLTDEAIVSNEWKKLEKFYADGSMIQIAVDLAGAWDGSFAGPGGTPAAVLPTMFVFNGFISGISTPPIEAGSDEALNYTVDFQLTAV
jgi:hypothetical protein